MSLHQGGPVVATGAPLAAARAAVVALHGRGATAQGIVDFLSGELDLGTVALVAPQARHGTWYPQSFLADFAANQPWLDSALARVGEIVAEVEAGGVPAERIVLFGFSQGACLASEFAARSPRRYGALVVATGGRIGPPGTRFEPTAEQLAERPLAGVPVHLSAGDPDAHVPWSRVDETASFFRALGAAVTTRREPGLPHAVHPAAGDFLRRRVDELRAS